MNITDSKDHPYNLDNYTINSATMEEICADHRLGFPFFAKCNEPHMFPNGIYPWHWHSYVQFIYVLEGRVEYKLESGSYLFRRGEGAFINSSVMHTLSCSNSKKCKYIELLFSPLFIGGSMQNDIMRNYVRPITDNSSFDIFRLDPDEEEHEEILDLLSEAYELFERNEEGAELLISSTLTLMWARFFSLTKPIRQTLVEDRPSSNRLKAMLFFINENYSERITLEQIAAAGTCSRRECNRTFKSQLGTTPFEYLTTIRMNKAATLLINSTMPITQISEQCGFSDPSHFTKAFKASFMKSPKQYRQEQQAASIRQ